ncbi:hypothetical protein N7509_011525 [Penicillium cosmopolitanum]|uniref:Uncharacterized protein n=1 Tax=Penicillium cosmopolitanum TaxID=1131564 RepID=A0A9W9SGY5_9EURO|nr:uncharacterized protein N7509_011525 [Penicillium cosmopolitanum]KAJ5378406.1 hypothetical protein N7509_011525 [Penicillium cosmopolitanum]
MPQWWERRLQKYEAYQAEFDREIGTLPLDLDSAVAIRLRDLKNVREDLKNNGDKRNLLSTVNALIEAYMSKGLNWNDGLVTYWSKRKKVCDGPKEFTWKDFDLYSEMHQGHQSFWVG